MATQAITTDAYKLYPSPHNLHRTVFDLQSFVPYPYALIYLPDFTLAGKATAAGFKVYRDFNQNLTYLVCGDKAGKSKLDKAQAAGIEIIDEPDFLDLMSNYNGA